MATIFRPLIVTTLRGKPTPPWLTSLAPSSRNPNLFPEKVLPVGRSAQDLPRVGPWRDVRTVAAAVPLAIATLPPPEQKFARILDLPRVAARLDIQTIAFSMPEVLLPQPPSLRFFQSVLDLPPAPARTNIQLRTWLQPYRFELTPLQSTTQFGTYDWPLPTGRPYPVPLRPGVASPNLLLAGKDALPFRQNDWPLPKGKRVSVYPHVVRPASAPTLMGIPITFQPFPLPTGKPMPVGLLFQAIDLTRTTLAPFVQPPFKPIAWPLPLVKPAAVSLRTHLSFFVVDDNAPFNQTDWRLPLAKPETRHLRPLIVPVPLNLVSKDALPFYQLHWPNPLAKPMLRDLLTHTRPAQVQLIGVDNVPFRQNDWPLPKSKPFPSDLRTFVQATNRLTSNTEILPFRQNDWPIPRAKGRPVVAKEHQEQLMLMLAGTEVLPFNQFDWPLPRTKGAPPMLYTCLSEMVLPIVIPEFPPELPALGHRDGAAQQPGAGHRSGVSAFGGHRGNPITPGSGKRRW